jgi:hypothetical protein
MKQIKQESGRSMVEMLGVLAVIGVLSVGGIAAYKNAMNRHEANSIRNEVNRQVVVWASESAFGRDFSPLNGNALGYQWEYPPKDMGDFIQFGVSGIEAEICEKVKSNDWKMVYVNENCTTFAFKNDLTQFVPQKTCSECNEECGVCDTLTGKCVPHDELCDKDKPYCGDNGICTQCENGFFHEASGSCKACSDPTTYTNVSRNECHACGNKISPVNAPTDCYDCTHTGRDVGAASAEDCLRCPNRIFTTAVWYNVWGLTTEMKNEGAGGCYYCDPVYGIQTPNRDDCLPNPDMPCPDTSDGTPQYFAFGSCSSCTNTDTTSSDRHTILEECNKCKGLRYYSSSWGKCVGTSEYTVEDGRRNGAGVVKEDCLAMEGVPLFFYGSDPNNGICEWCPTAIVTNGNGEKVCEATCPTGTYLYLEHKQWGQNSCKPCPADTSGLTAEEQAQCNP